MSRAIGASAGRLVLLAGLALTACGAGGEAGGPCAPGLRECRDGDVWACRADGTGFERVVACPVATTTCAEGSCVPLGFADGGADADAPAPEATPEPPGSEPLPDAAEPLPDAAEPLPDAAEPTPDPDLVDPAPEALEPGVDGSEPHAEVASPDGPEATSDLPQAEPWSELPDEPATPACGDGHVQPPEACEPGQPLGTTCAQAGYASGTLGCRDDCSLDTSGCDALGPLAYEKLQNLSFLDDFVDVAWRSDGAEAYFVRQGGGLVHYDPTPRALSAVTLPSGFLARRVVPVPFEAALLLAGSATSPSTSARLLRYDPADGSFVELEAFRADGYEWVAGGFSPDGKRFVAGGRKPSSQGSLLRHSGVPFGEGTTDAHLPTWPNLTDLVWVAAGAYGVPHVKTVEGVNGSDSHDWIVETGVLLDTGPPGFGNFGRGQARPAGDCAVFGAWSTQNKVYAFSGGAWAYLAFNAPYFSAASAAWNATGTRLLVVGDAGGGADLVGSVHELRPGPAGCSPGTWVSQVIPDFDAAPWLGKGDTWLHHAAWRPNSDCAEGLIAGADNGLSYEPTFGLAIRFHDTADPACD